MVDLELQVPATDEVEVDDAAGAGRSVSLEEVREMIPKWISKFESQTRR